MSSQQTYPEVRRRRVFYIPGYDPFHPRRYRELYRAEGDAQAVISGYNIAIRGRTGRDLYGWHVRSQQDGAVAEAEIDVLVWSDLVRQSMARSIPATYLQLARTAWIYISTGTLWHLMQLRKGPVIAALYPVGMLLLQLIAALGLAWFLYVLSHPLVGWWGLPLAIGAAYTLLHWFRKLDNRLFAYYLMHDYAHSARLRGAYAPEMKERLAQFSDLITDALSSNLDEVLVVGHSSGAHLGVSVLAELLRRQKVPESGPVLSFLTLGQVVPMVSFLPAASGLRADLRYLSEHPDLTWVDVSAPGDGCAFALCDPVSVSGVATADKRGPLVLSAAFTQTLSAERWRQLRWRFFRLHFQYLCAFDQPGDYDYFRITAGPHTLANRFRGRAPSQSRIERPVSKYTSVRA